MKQKIEGGKKKLLKWKINLYWELQNGLEKARKLNALLFPIKQ